MVSKYSPDIIGPDGAVEARVCVDCRNAKPIDQFQRTPKAGGRAKDCKACRRKKSENAMAAIGLTKAKPATKEWVIEQATILFNKALRDSDKAKYLDLISKNLNANAQDITDDAKIIRDLIASKKKQKELNGS
jgi:hypothetical protein